MKGIVLAGGSGTRLSPVTRASSKQLLPIYDKPMVYYPLSLLMLAGVTQVLVISTPEHLGQFKTLLGEGGKWGLQIEYAVQARPEGLPQALLIGEDFLNGEKSILVLGDNILYGSGLSGLLKSSALFDSGAVIFGYPVADPERFGVVEIGGRGDPTAIEEKPLSPKSNLAIVGLYYFDEMASSLAAELTPSTRGELEIVHLLRKYLEAGMLRVERLGRGIAWLDAGTPESLHEAASFVQTIEKRQGLKIACPEEIAYREGLIDRDQLKSLAIAMDNSEYGRYLLDLVMLESDPV